MIRRFIKVVLHEWKLFFTDPAAVLLLVLAGVFYSVYYPLPYVNQLAEKIPVAIVDQDQSVLSRQITRMSEATQQLQVAYVYGDAHEAEKAMAEEKIYGFMVIPKGMERQVHRGESSGLGIYTHGAYVMLHGTIGTAFATVAATASANIKVKKIAAAHKLPVKSAMAVRDPFPLRIQNLFNGSTGYANYVVPSVLMLILQQTLLIGICTLGGSRKQRSFLSNKKRFSVVENESLMYRYFGRFTAYFLHYCLFLSFYHVVIYQVFDFPRRGAAGPMILFAALFFSATIHLGMSISLLFKRRESSLQAFLFFSIPLLFLSGFSWPQSAMPQWIQYVSYLFPSTFAIPAWTAIEQMGAGVAEIAHYLWALGAQTILYLGIGLFWTYKRR